MRDLWSLLAKAAAYRHAAEIAERIENDRDQERLKSHPLRDTIIEVRAAENRQSDERQAVEDLPE